MSWVEEGCTCVNDMPICSEVATILYILYKWAMKLAKVHRPLAKYMYILDAQPNAVCH